MPIRMTLIINPTIVANTPRVTNTSTIEETQSTNGLIITRNPLDMKDMIYFKITNISGGTVYKHDGITEISNDYSEFITHLEGLEGLKFTPDPDVTVASFRIRASTTASNVGLGGNYITARIDVVPAELTFGHTPSITNSSTVEEIQTADGLIITPNILDDVNDIYYKITSIANGTLFLFDGMTEIAEDSFITGDEGAAGLKFTPNSGLDSGSFGIQASTTNSDVGLGGDIVFATITVTSAEILAPAWSETDPAVVLAWMQATFSKASTGTPSMSVTEQQLSLSYMAMGGNLAPNGLAFSVPYAHGSVQPYWYDYATDTKVSSGVNYNGYAGGVLLPNGLIMWVPKESRKIILVDPVAKTFTEVGTEIGGYFGGVYAANGKAVLSPYQASKVGLYDYASGVFTEGPANTTPHRGAVRAADGKIILMPFAPGGKIGIYDPVANSYTEGPTAGGYYTGGRLLPNGKILMVPDGSTGNYLGVYDPIANTFVDGPTLGEDSWVGSVMCPDGKVAITNTNTANIGIYNSADNTVAIIVAPQTKQWGGTLLPNGKVIFWTWQYETQVIFDPACGIIPIDSLLTPWINHL